jgi:hypothetical protein
MLPGFLALQEASENPVITFPQEHIVMFNMMKQARM